MGTVLFLRHLLCRRLYKHLKTKTFTYLNDLRVASTYSLWIIKWRSLEYDRLPWNIWSVTLPNPTQGGTSPSQWEGLSRRSFPKVCRVAWYTYVRSNLSLHWLRRILILFRVATYSIVSSVDLSPLVVTKVHILSCSRVTSFPVPSSQRKIFSLIPSSSCTVGVTSVIPCLSEVNVLGWLGQSWGRVGTQRKRPGSITTEGGISGRDKILGDKGIPRKVSKHL